MINPLNEFHPSDQTGIDLLTAFFHDPDVEAMTMYDGNIFVERQGQREKVSTLPNRQATQWIHDIIRHCHAEDQESQPLLTFTWPENDARINIVHGIDSQPEIITIRKPRDESPADLAALIQANVLTPEASRFLLTAIQTHRHILITGAGGSGKTSVLRALAEAGMNSQDRVAVLEDFDELRLAHPNCRHWVAEEPTTLHDLVPRALSMCPDHIIVGELHGLEAGDFLEAGLTESAGLLATMSADRLDGLAYRLFWAMATDNHWDASRYDVLAAQIAQAVDLIVHMEYLPEKRGNWRFRISHIVQAIPDGSVQPLFQWSPHQQALVRVDEGRAQ